MHRNIFLTVLWFCGLSIVLLFENSFDKASGLLFIFIRLSMDHDHF